MHSSAVVPENSYKVSEKATRNLLKTHVIHFCSFACDAHEIDKKSWNNKEITLDSNTSQKSRENIPKPRTALFQGGEDDEPMAPHNVKIGEFCIDVKQGK
jgi:hypothetical protein